MSMEVFDKLPLLRQFDELMKVYHVLASESCETEFLQFASQFEHFRKRGYQAENFSQQLQEKLTKAEAEKNALMIKLKHARRQIEVELKQRQKAEQERDELDQQILLVRELLFSDETGNLPLNEEQQKKLDFLNSSRFTSPHGGSRAMHRRLDPIDETCSILSDYSDISFDNTEDDLDATTLRNGKRFKRQRMAARRAHGEDESMSKRLRHEPNSPVHNSSYQAAMDFNHSYSLKANEQLKCTVDGPAKVNVEKLERTFSRPAPHQGRRRQSREHRRRSAGLTSDSETQASDVENFWPTAPEPSAKLPRSILKGIQTTPTKYTGKLHNMQPRACVIVKEICTPCGKRIQFGKRAVKCHDCRLVTHPECESKAREFPCDPSQFSPSTPSSSSDKLTLPAALEDFLHTQERPQIPSIIYHTVHEIDNRGMEEVGLYRVPGMIRSVRELKEKFLKGRVVPDLSKITDVHTLCSLVKEFLRECLKEPLLTYELLPKFVSAAQQDTDCDLYQALSELPQANRDTLSFLMLHLQRIVEVPEIRMGPEALSKAMGPSLIGFSQPDPSIEELQIASIYQEKVLTHLLQLPTDYYTNVMRSGHMEHDVGTPEAYRETKRPQKTPRSKKLGGKVDSTTDLYKAPESVLGPVGNSPRKTPSGSSLAERAKKYLHGTPFGRGKRKENFFDTPSLQ